MNRIEKKTQLSKDVYRIRVAAPLIAEQHRPGQFVIVQLSENGERIPLTIADSDTTNGTITLIFQAVGKTTHMLASISEQERIAHILGPLGKPTEIEKYGHAICVGGGIGTAPLYPIAKALKRAGNNTSIIIGARSRELVLLEDQMKAISNNVTVCTDDGSYGRKALVTDPLLEMCRATPTPDIVVAIGPPVMMKACAETTRPFGIRTIVSLNTIMIDGTGMCGGCRVTVGGKTKFVCVDGPEFDGHKVDFDQLTSRLGAYKDQEDTAHHKCHIDLGIAE